jgi:hypothetical protein
MKIELARWHRTAAIQSLLRVGRNDFLKFAITLKFSQPVTLFFPHSFFSILGSWRRIAVYRPRINLVHNSSHIAAAIVSSFSIPVAPTFPVRDLDFAVAKVAFAAPVAVSVPTVNVAVAELI